MALKNADARRRGRNPVVKEVMKKGIEKYANERLVPGAGVRKARQWHDIAVGENVPVVVIYEKYLSGGGQEFSLSTRNNLATAWKHFLAFFSDGIAIQEVDRLWASKFATRYLPSCTTPKAPEGPGPATIRKTRRPFSPKDTAKLLKAECSGSSLVQRHIHKIKMSLHYLFGFASIFPK